MSPQANVRLRRRPSHGSCSDSPKTGNPGLETRDKGTLSLLEREELSLDELRRNYINSVDAGSKTYEQRGNQYRLEVERKVYLEEVLPEAEELVLDAGCGTGHYLPDLLKNNIRVIGCDMSIGCLEICRERCDGVGIGRLSALRASVCNLPFASNSFDRVITRHVLQHIPLASERLRALEEFCRTLRPGGWLHIVTYNRSVRHALRGKKENIVAKRYYYYLYSARELTRDIKSVFGRRPKVRGVCNTIPLLPRLGALGVWIDQRMSLLPLASCLNSYVLLASVRK